MKYYFPGMISFLVIPVLFNYFVNNYTRKHNKEVLLNLVVARSGLLQEKVLIFSFGNQKVIRRFDSIETVIISGKNDEGKISQSQQFIRNAIKENRKNIAINYFFNESSSYNSFIEVLNVMMIEGVKNYIPFDNQIIALIQSEDTNKHTETLKCGVEYRLKLDKQKENEKRRKEIFMEYSIKFLPFFLYF